MNMKLFIRELIGGCFLIIPSLVFAQNIEIRDSIKTEVKDMDYNVQPIRIDNGNQVLRPQTNNMENYATSSSSPRLTVPLFFTLSKDNNPLTPFKLYNYSSKNQLEGIILQGMYNRFVLNSFLTADLNIFVSGYGNLLFQSYTYVNGSAKIDLILKLHDRIQLIGMGQISLREGIDPKFPSSFGSSNYYGAGIQIKVTNKVGLGIGVTNSYFRGAWTKQTYFTPVGY